MNVMTLDTIIEGTKRESFIVNQLRCRHRVEYARHGDYLVDGKYTIEVSGKSKDGKTHILIGECKWTSGKNGHLLTNELCKISQTHSFTKNRTVNIVIFPNLPRPMIPATASYCR